MARSSSKHTLQFAARVRELAQSRREAVTGGHQFIGPWFSSATAALYLDQPTGEAFRRWARRHGVVGVWKGGLLRFSKRDIDLVGV